jgi:hypothetical protein
VTLGYLLDTRLATANDKDFIRFKGLRVENWSKRHVRQKKEPATD